MSQYLEKQLVNGWFSEFSYHGTMGQSYKVKSVLHSEKTPFQQIDVLDTEPLGRLLLLDGKTMVSNLDEFVYHESIAHVPSMAAKTLKKVLIVGGGDGGVVREFAKYPEIEQIDLVEIDERVIEVSKEFFPECTTALSDPRVNILATDGIEFIRKQTNTYDVIIIDSTDPEDFAEGLFKADFYNDVEKALTENGIMAAQTENPFFDEYNVGDIYKNLRLAFPQVHSYNAPISIYPGVFWTFAFASKNINPKELNQKRLDHMKKLENDLKWYNHEWHQGAFMLSNFQKRKMGL